jgi:ABC-2 type transport system permease protein
VSGPGLRQVWLVAAREMRERSRSRAFRASLLVMLLVVVGMIVVPALLEGRDGPKDVGLTGAVPAELAAVLEAQGQAVETPLRLHRYDTLGAGQQAVRDGDVDVLVVDARRLEWQRSTDEQLRALVTGAIQLVAVRERAAAAGISPDDLAAVVAPVPVEEVELGRVAGRSPDDEAAAFVMTVLLFIAISTYGNLVLTGVVAEKASRVVEVLLARMPARRLLAGKVAGIGLLGLAQVALTAVVGLVAMAAVGTVDIPAARGGVVAWAVVWFVLGYAVYAVAYGTLGSLASRTEDAQTVAGPVIAVLLVCYFASFAAIGSPETGWATFLSYFPATAPMAMPNRIAMGAAAWWEPVVAVAVSVAAIDGLIRLGGRVYSGAVLHSGPTLKLRDAWRRTPGPGRPRGGALGLHRPAHR